MTKNKTTTVILVPIILVFQQLVSKISGLIANIFDYSTIDKYNVFAWISVHHISQLLIAIAAIAMLSKIMNIDFGFHTGDKKKGIKLTSIYLISMILYISITSAIAFLNNKSFQHDFPLNETNVIGALGFQLFLSGTSEEVLFRALPISLMNRNAVLSKQIKLGRINISLSNLFAAVFFALAHIKWTIYPFSLNYSLGQLLVSFILGIAYGVVYEKCQSILYPMIMHSLTNVAVVGSGFLMSVWKS